MKIVGKIFLKILTEYKIEQLPCKLLLFPENKHLLDICTYAYKNFYYFTEMKYNMLTPFINSNENYLLIIVEAIATYSINNIKYGYGMKMIKGTVKKVNSMIFIYR